MSKMSWTGFVLIQKDGKDHSAYLSTTRNYALQSYQAGLNQKIYTDSQDAERKGIIIAYVEIERKDE